MRVAIILAHNLESDRLGDPGHENCVNSKVCFKPMPTLPREPHVMTPVSNAFPFGTSCRRNGSRKVAGHPLKTRHSDHQHHSTSHNGVHFSLQVAAAGRNLQTGPLHDPSCMDWTMAALEQRLGKCICPQDPPGHGPACRAGIHGIWLVVAIVLCSDID